MRSPFPSSLRIRPFAGGGGGGGGGGSNAASGSAAAGAPRPAISVSEIVGPQFEEESRTALRHILRRICPWASDFSDIIARSSLELGGEEGAVEARQVDIFCYATGDTLGECVDERESGAVVLRQEGGEFVPALRAAAVAEGASFSPADRSVVGPHKYIVGEAYSGGNPRTIADKIQQLDTAVDFIVRRFADRSGIDVTDTTEVVGAAALFFSSAQRSRHDVLTDCVRMVRQRLGSHPRLQRLSRAGRLLVIVLDRSQTPNSFAHRCMVTSLAGRLDIVFE